MLFIINLAIIVAFEHFKQASFILALQRNFLSILL